MDTTLFATLGLPFFSLLTLAFLALFFSSFVKIATVLGIVRAGLGFQSLPSVFVTGAVAIALSILVMAPTYTSSTRAMDGVLKASGVVNDSVRADALAAGMTEWKTFLGANASQENKEKFYELATQLSEKSSANETIEQESWRVVTPAFIVTELKEAFATGLSLFLPLLVIDLLVANILMAVGYVQLNPLFISLPFKLLLFVMLDGWSLISTNLVGSYLT